MKLKFSPAIKLGAILLSIFICLAVYKVLAIRKAMAGFGGPPPTAVTEYPLTESSWNQSLQIVGSLAPSQGIMLSSEEAGKVISLGFESGGKVKKGDLLVQIDISVEQAQLDAAQAKADLARINLKRTQTLRQQNAASESALNDAVAQTKESEAQVAELKARVLRKTIVAPFDGRIGIRNVNVGQYLAPGTSIVPLHSLDPLFLNFLVPQQHFAALYIKQKVNFTVDAYPEESFSAEVSAIDPQLDEQTRSVRVQAVISNPEDHLRPGMFAKVALTIGSPIKIIAVPSTAINFAPYGDSVYTIELMQGPDKKEYLGVKQKFVKLGESQGDLVAIASGVDVGERIVASGVFKLRPGAAITLSSLAPEASLPAKDIPNT